EGVPLSGGFVRGLVALIGVGVAMFGLFQVAQKSNYFGLVSKNLDNQSEKHIEIAVSAPELSAEKRLAVPVTGRVIKDVPDQNLGGLSVPEKDDETGLVESLKRASVR
ncbi:MAG: hypothetical protein ABL857_04230, partial [Rickettsiales bacterium]